MKTFVSALWAKRWVRFLGWAAVWLVTLLVLLWQGVNWYGAREWQKVLVELEKEGETLDYRKVVRDPVPVEENFCAIPALLNVSLYGDTGAEEKRNRLKEMRLPQGQGDKGPPKPSLSSGLMLGEPMSLKAWREWLAEMEPAAGVKEGSDEAVAVLARWEKHKPLWNALVGGVSRDEAQWTPEWRTRELPEYFFSLGVPHYEMAQALGSPLALLSVAAAQADQEANAHASLHVLLKLNRACRNDALLIGTLVAATGDFAAASTVWELCWAQVGSVEDFLKLERELAKVDYRHALLQAIRGEMAAGANSLMWLKKNGGIGEAVRTIRGMADHREAGEGGADWLAGMLPAGWYDLNVVSVVRTELRYLINPLKQEGLKVVCDRSQLLEDEIERMKVSMNPMHFMTTATLPSLVRIGDRVLYIQGVMDQALIACVLERYRLEHGKYPEALDGLKLADGRALPVDVMSGKAMGYALDGNGRYRLWSVGWDGKDDGGKRTLNEKEPQKSGFAKREYVGDWVWDFVK